MGIMHWHWWNPHILNSSQIAELFTCFRNQKAYITYRSQMHTYITYTGNKTVMHSRSKDVHLEPLRFHKAPYCPLCCLTCICNHCMRSSENLGGQIFNMLMIFSLFCTSSWSQGGYRNPESVPEGRLINGRWKRWPGFKGALEILLDWDLLLLDKEVAAAKSTLYQLWLISQMWPFVGRWDLWFVTCLD